MEIKQTKRKTFLCRKHYMWSTFQIMQGKGSSQPEEACHIRKLVITTVSASNSITPHRNASLCALWSTIPAIQSENSWKSTPVLKIVPHSERSKQDSVPQIRFHLFLVPLINSLLHLELYTTISIYSHYHSSLIFIIWRHYHICRVFWLKLG